MFYGNSSIIFGKVSPQAGGTVAGAVPQARALPSENGAGSVFGQLGPWRDVCLPYRAVVTENRL